MSDERLSEAVAAVLAEHAPVLGVFDRRAGIVGCSCLSARDYRAAGHKAGQEGWRTHVAAALAAVEAAHARDLAALRERAEVAESKVAAVERLCEDLHEDAQAITNTNVEALAHRGALQDVRRRVLVTLADRPAGGEATTRAPSIGTEPYRGKG